MHMFGPFHCDQGSPCVVQSVPGYCQTHVCLNLIDIRKSVFFQDVAAEWVTKGSVGS